MPDWRKGRNYHESYSVNVHKGGGVLRDLSHEIDYLMWMFGCVKEIISLGGHYSNLEGDSDDIYKIILKWKDVKVFH